MAFNCILGDPCPRHGDIERGGCPCWWEIPWENQETGEVAMRKGCILSQEMGLPIVQVIVRSAHVASEHASVARNSVEQGFGVIVQAVNAYRLEQRKLHFIEGPAEVE